MPLEGLAIVPRVKPSSDKRSDPEPALERVPAIITTTSRKHLEAAARRAGAGRCRRAEPRAWLPIRTELHFVISIGGGLPRLWRVNEVN